MDCLLNGEIYIRYGISITHIDILIDTENIIIHNHFSWNDECDCFGFYH